MEALFPQTFRPFPIRPVPRQPQRANLLASDRSEPGNQRWDEVGIFTQLSVLVVVLENVVVVGWVSHAFVVSCGASWLNGVAFLSQLHSGFPQIGFYGELDFALQLHIDCWWLVIPKVRRVTRSHTLEILKIIICRLLVIFLSFVCVIFLSFCVLGCHLFVIVLLFFCHFVVIFLSFFCHCCCHFSVIFLSFCKVFQWKPRTFFVFFEDFLGNPMIFVVFSRVLLKNQWFFQGFSLCFFVFWKDFLYFEYKFLIFCHLFVIFCHFLLFFCHFFLIFLSFFCHFVICLSFFCHFVRFSNENLQPFSFFQRFPRKSNHFCGVF